MKRSLKRNELQPSVEARRAGSLASSEGFACTAPIADRGPTGGWCHIFLPPEASTFLGKRGHVPIVISVNGVEFQRTARPDGKGGHFILFNHEMRERTGTGAGDAVDLFVRIDKSPSELSTPADLHQALENAPKAKAAFEAMPASHRKACIEFIDEARKAETRARRIARTLELINSRGKERAGRK